MSLFIQPCFFYFFLADYSYALVNLVIAIDSLIFFFLLIFLARTYLVAELVLQTRDEEDEY